MRLSIDEVADMNELLLVRLVNERRAHDEARRQNER